MRKKLPSQEWLINAAAMDELSKFCGLTDFSSIIILLIIGNN